MHSASQRRGDGRLSQAFLADHDKPRVAPFFGLPRPIEILLQPIADRLNEVASARGESFLTRYGGRISSEWYFPKLIELWLEDRAVYDAARRFMEATDWIVWQLTGNEVRQSCTAGYKAMWSQEEGLPPTDYFAAAYPEFDRPAAKLGTRFVPLGTRAGPLRAELAARYRLPESVAVAVGNVDSFVSVPGAGVESRRCVTRHGVGQQRVSRVTLFSDSASFGRFGCSSIRVLWTMWPARRPIGFFARRSSA